MGIMEIRAKKVFAGPGTSWVAEALVEGRGDNKVYVTVHYYDGEEYTVSRENVYDFLTDEDDVPDALLKLRVIYPNIMKLDYDNARTRNISRAEMTEEVERKSGIELFSEFFEKQNGRPMSEEQYAFSEQLLRKIGEEIQ